MWLVLASKGVGIFSWTFLLEVGTKLESHVSPGKRDMNSDPFQEEQGELGIWITQGRLQQLVGFEEAADLVLELPSKMDAASGRPLFFIVRKELNTRHSNHLALGSSSS